MLNVNINYDIEPKKLYRFKRDFENITKEVYKILKLHGQLYFDCSFVDINEIHQINKTYRGIDRPTDVISFALKEYDNNLCLLGEIFICYEKIVEQAKEYCHSFRREVCFLFLHGLLHILGYDHMTPEDEKVMFSLQDEILNNLNIKR